MVIGFTERRQTVSEGQVPGVDEFPHSVGLQTAIRNDFVPEDEECYSYTYISN